MDVNQNTVKFIRTDRAKYNEIVHDGDTLYFILDTHQIYLGDKLVVPDSDKLVKDISAVSNGISITFGDGSTKDISLTSIPDYAQNDTSQPDYIKNRTHYKEVIHQEKVDLLPSTEIDFSSLGDMGYTQSEPLNIQVGDTVKVLWSAQEYECVAQSVATLDPGGNAWIPSDGIVFGNLYFAFEVNPDSQHIPFIVVSNYTTSEQGEVISGCVIMPVVELTNPITVNIFSGGDKAVYHKLDINYLPITESDISSDENSVVTSRLLLTYLMVNRPDWSVDDSGDPRYIKERPFYRSLGETSESGLIRQTITLDENGIYAPKQQLCEFTNSWNNSYDSDVDITVRWHDGTYNCKLRRVHVEWTNEDGYHQGYNYFVFGNVSDIASYNDTAPFLIYADFNPETKTIGETYIKAYDGFTGELTLQVDAHYRNWVYQKIDNRYLNLSSSVYQGNDNAVTGDAVYNAISSEISSAISSAIGTALGGSY